MVIFACTIAFTGSPAGNQFEAATSAFTRVYDALSGGRLMPFGRRAIARMLIAATAAAVFGIMLAPFPAEAAYTAKTAWTT